MSKLIVGLDEAGRGCLLGRVYSAAVIYTGDFENLPFKVNSWDSKKISKKKREVLFDWIKENADFHAISYADEKIIDDVNILQATQQTFHENLDKLNICSKNHKIVVDGNYFRAYIDKDGNFVEYICVPQGDDKFHEVGMASILAKVAHDKYIEELIAENPYLEKYDLTKNVGYGTKKHRDALKENGYTEFHRKSFKLKK